MNWNKLLNIVIILFAVMNIGVFIYNRASHEQEYELTQERREQLNQVLKDHNVTIYNFYPTYEPMGTYLLDIPAFDRVAILNRLFDGMYESTRDIEQRIIYDTYSNEGEAITFYENNYSGIIHYEGPSSLYKPMTFDEASVVALGQEFSDDLIGEVVALKLSSVTYDEIQDVYKLLFNEDNDQVHMFCNYVQLVIGKNGILSADASIYPGVEAMNNEEDLYPVDMVLYHWLEEEHVSLGDATIINRIDLGYHLGQEELTKDTNIEAVPHYRIMTSEGQVYEINAYTNQLRVE